MAACDDGGGNRIAPDTTLDAVPAALSNQAHVEILFHNLGNANQFFCTIDGALPAPCVSPFVADLSDGAHAFTVAAALNNNIDETPASHEWTIDTVVPQTNIISGPPPLDNTPAPELTFAGTDNNPGTVTFECAVDTGAFAACASPIVLPTLVDGIHQFSVRAKDAAGNVDPTPATLGWTLDTAAPDTTITNGPSAGSTTAASVVFEFTSNDATATFECAADTGAFAACASPLPVVLGDGPHTFIVRAKDSNGIVDPSPASRAWTIDATPPAVTITQTPADPSNDPSPAFAFTASETATFACQLDGGAFVACTSPFTAASLADGSHAFAVRATDGVGNTGTAATFGWLVDTAAPTVTITSAPAALSNDATPTVAFTVPGGASAIECQVDGGAFAACTSPFTAATLADGSHTITVRASDAAGNSSSASATFAIDTVPPTVTLTSVPGALSNDKTPTVAFTTANGATATTCRVDAGTFGACTSPFTSTALADGSHTITVRAVDAAGNAATATTPSFTIDTVPPTVTITSQPAALSNDTTATVAFTTAGGATSISCGVDAGVPAACSSPFTTGALADGAHTITVLVADGAGNTASATTASFTVDTLPPTITFTSQPAALSNDVTPTVTFTVAGATTTTCQVDAGAFAACLSPFTTTALADGSHTISVRASDGAGNVATATTASFTIDTAPPTITLTSQPAALSNDATPAVAFTVAGATTIECRSDAGTFVACTSPFTAGPLADGTHTLTVRATDGAGNIATATTASFTIDTAPPTITITSEPPALSNDPTPVTAFTVAGAGTIECRVDAGTFAACTSPFTAGPLADGAHTVTIRASDAAGNVATAVTGSFTIDTVPPTVTITSQPAALSNDATPSVAFTTGGGATATTCRVDAGTFVACTSPFTTSALADGAHTITIRAVDGAGNAATATTASFTIDTVPPTITITSQPAALSNDNTPTVAFTVAGGATSISCRVDSGVASACTSPFTPAAVIADGTHAITIQAADGANNLATATTATFTIDTVPPTVTIVTQPAALSNDATPTVTFTTAGGATATSCQVDTGAFAACTSPFTAGPLADGSHTITVRAVDGAGNAANAATSPFAIDTVPPTIVITLQPAALSNDKTPTIAFTAGGGATLTECRIDAGAFVACTSPFTTPSLADGNHAIAVRATDGAGNTAIASSIAFVIDTVAPTVVLDDVPPAQWPVDYFDMRFHATEAATFTCSLNGSAFAACANGQTVTTVYNVTSSFSVRATDGAGNIGTATTTWVSSDGLVLHYPWEQGATNNSSLLTQNPAYSPNGSIAAVPFLGGWAGTAAGSTVPAHTYAGTNRALLSAASPGTGTASFWIRTNSDSESGTIFSTLGAAGGMRVRVSSVQLTVEVVDPGAAATTPATTVPLTLGPWTHVALRATGPGKGLQIWLNGNLVDVVAAPSATGFDPGMAKDLTVGGWNQLDVDDLRFFNVAVPDAAICNQLARGFPNPASGQCVPLAPGYELDFENTQLVDSGIWRLQLQPPSVFDFVPTTTGDGIKLPAAQDWGYGRGFAAQVAAIPVGRSFSLWFDPSQPAFGPLFDATRSCVVGGPLCGVRLDFLDTGTLVLFVGTDKGFQKTVQIPVGTKRTSVVVAEQRTALNGDTRSVSVFLNGALAITIDVAAGDVYGVVRDDVRMPQPASVAVDELEFWPADLAKDPEMLCENGFDGAFDHATGSCLLTSN